MYKSVFDLLQWPYQSGFRVPKTLLFRYRKISIAVLYVYIMGNSIVVLYVYITDKSIAVLYVYIPGQSIAVL